VTGRPPLSDYPQLNGMYLLVGKLIGRYKAELPQAHELHGTGHGTVRDWAATRCQHAPLRAYSNQPTDLWHAVEIAGAPTMITDCIFDAPDHWLGTRISSGPPCAMPKLNIVYAVHHLLAMLPPILIGNHQRSLAFASEAQRAARPTTITGR